MISADMSFQSQCGKLETMRRHVFGGGVCQLLHALESTIEDKTAIEMGRE